MAEKKKEEKTSFFSGVNKYFREMRSEAKKVSWPTASQLFHDTGIVLVMVVVFGVFIWGTDVVMGLISDYFLGS